MARQLYYMNQVGVGNVASGSGLPGGNAYSGPGGDQGHGWSFQGSWTNTQFTAQNPTIVIPSNARDLSVTYSYNGAATVTFVMIGSNGDQVSVVADTTPFGTVAPTFCPSIVGGSSNSTAITGVIPAPPLYLSGRIGGTGSAGADTIIITVSCNTVIRP